MANQRIGLVPVPPVCVTARRGGSCIQRARTTAGRVIWSSIDRAVLVLQRVVTLDELLARAEWVVEGRRRTPAVT